MSILKVFVALNSISYILHISLYESNEELEYAIQTYLIKILEGSSKVLLYGIFNERDCKGNWNSESKDCA